MKAKINIALRDATQDRKSTTGKAKVFFKALLLQVIPISVTFPFRVWLLFHALNFYFKN